HATLPFPRDLEDGPQADRVEVFRVDRACRVACDLDDRNLLDTELEAHAFHRGGGHAQSRSTDLREIAQPREADRGVARDDEVALAFVQLTGEAAAVRARPHARLRAPREGQQVPAGL